MARCVRHARLAQQMLMAMMRRSWYHMRCHHMHRKRERCEQCVYAMPCWHDECCRQCCVRAGTTRDATTCADNENVVSNVCTPCPAGTTNAVGDDSSKSGTTCDSTKCADDEEVVSMRVWHALLALRMMPAMMHRGRHIYMLANNKIKMVTEISTTTSAARPHQRQSSQTNSIAYPAGSD